MFLACPFPPTCPPYGHVPPDPMQRWLHLFPLLTLPRLHTSSEFQGAWACPEYFRHLLRSFHTHPTCGFASEVCVCASDHLPGARRRKRRLFLDAGLFPVNSPPPLRNSRGPATGRPSLFGGCYFMALLLLWWNIFLLIILEVPHEYGHL